MIYKIESIKINGVNQYISIRYKTPGLPLLIYLHGGPGDAAMPLVSKYNQKLAEAYTVVTWEQRGAGKSYYPFSDTEQVNIQVFISDLYELIKILLVRHNQEKVYLVGHSWGSVLGLTLIQQHPEIVQMYIGCGQVVNMRKGSEKAREFAIEKNVQSGNSKVADQLKKIDCSYTGQEWINDLLFVTKQVVKHKGSLYGKSSYNSLIKDFIFSSEYTLRDLINRQKGSLQSIQYLWQELMNVDFEAVIKFDVPVCFVEGRYDYHVSSELCYEFYQSIQSEKQFHWFEKSCHFPQWSEAQKFNDLLRSFLP